MIAVECHQFAVHHKALGRQMRQRRHHVREALVERQAVSRQQVDPVGVPHGEAAQAVEFPLVLPRAGPAGLEVGRRPHQGGQHRRNERNGSRGTALTVATPPALLSRQPE